MKVLLTIDTETYPLRSSWRGEGLRDDIKRDVYGVTCERELGLRYLVRVLKEHRLKGVFFTEPLFTEITGLAPLEEMVREIQRAGHEVAAHPHPAWLAWAGEAPFCDRGPQAMPDFSPAEQAEIIRRGVARLREAGARDVCAFRASDGAATRATLRALPALGIRYDASYNACLPASSLADVPELGGRNHPVWCEGVWALPLAVWHAPPTGLRPAQITEAPAADLRNALLSAWRGGWSTFVLTTRSFGLLENRRRRVYAPRPDWQGVQRFESLCCFLAEHRDEFETCGFADLDPTTLASAPAARALRSPVHRTVARIIEQTYRSLTVTS